MKTDIALKEDVLARPEQDVAERLRFWRRSLSKHKWPALGLALLVIAVAAYKVYTETPLYSATATILIETDKPKVVSIEEVYSGIGTNRDQLHTQAEVLKSHALHKKLVRKLGLHKQPAPKPEEPTVARAEWLNSRWLPWNWIPAEWLPANWWSSEEDTRPPSEEERIEAAAADIKNNLGVDVVRNSQLIRISFFSPSPELAAKMANALVDVYIENDLDARMQMTQQANAWLTERLAGLRQKVSEAEQALQQFRDRERIVEVKTVALSGVGNQLAQLTGNIVIARQKRVEAENDLAQVQAAQRNGTPLETIPAILKNPSVQRFRDQEAEVEKKISEFGKRYGPEHPRMIALDAELKAAKDNTKKQIQVAVAAIGKELEIARANESSLERVMSETKSSIQDMNRKEFQLGVLEREVTASRQMYDMFLNRFRETTVARDMRSTIARMIDPATVPDFPVRPNKKRTLMIAVIFGLMLGGMLAFLLEYLDNTVKNSDDVEHKLGLPLLGVLQRVRGWSKDAVVGRAVISDSQSVFAESVRTLRTSVLMSALDDPHKVLLVTSSVAEEGKTTVALNLAFAFGQIKKVCLVDADMRRPQVAASARVDRSLPGFSHLVAGTEPIEKCMHLDEASGIHIIPAGVVPPNPQELLSSRRFNEVMKELHRIFDIVVVDSPPLQLMSDALVLSSHANAVIYVVKANSTPYQIVRSGIERLRKVGAPTLGIVLNQLDTRKADKYYGYGKYSTYGKGYSYYGYADRS
jgi:capsular exopolysaccharide synthesis family protein